MENCCYPFVNTPLPYEYDALEPYIDEKTMHLHHDKHLQTYINNLNEALKNEPSLQKMSLDKLIRCACELAKPLQAPIRNNAGGVYNHRFYFSGLGGSSGRGPEGVLKREIDRRFGSFERFTAEWKKAALSVFGSGYAWLVWDGSGLRIVTTANQDCPLKDGLTPILCVDVWEHAYYLKHYNDRGSYVEDWLDVVNWARAEENLLRCARP